MNECLKHLDPETYWDCYTATISLTGPEQKHFQVKFRVDGHYVKNIRNIDDEKKMVEVLSYMVTAALFDLLKTMHGRREEDTK
jgi:hypothetical protein